MSLLPLFQWLTNAPAFALMRNSKWAFAIVEMVHLLALTGLGGVVLLVDLGVLGVGLRRRPIANVARELSPIFGWCLATMMVSGALLVTAEPMKCYYHPAFRLKMVLFAVALIFALTVHRRSVNSVSERPLPGLKLASIASLTLWLRSQILFRSLDFFERIRSTNLAWFGIDELTHCKEESWLRLEARLRDRTAQKLCGFTSWTPKGFDWVYDRFIGTDKKRGHVAFRAERYQRIFTAG